MESLAAASSVVGLAVIVFQMAKNLQENIKLALSERKEVTDLIEENEDEMRLLQDLYNAHKELLDQSKLTEDMEQLHKKMAELQGLLVDVKTNMGDGRLPTVKEVWKAGDLESTLEKLNRGIRRIRGRWQDRVGTCTLALLHDRTAQLLDRVDRQDRVQANNALTVVETIRSEATEVIKVIQQTSTGPRASTLSVHSQVESVRITKDSTRLVADTAPAAPTFSILSTDTSLSYDKIKHRLEEYKKLIESDSTTIECLTENGEVRVTRKHVDKLEGFLQKAHTLLQQMADSQHAPTLVMARRLRDLATVLDKLSLSTECTNVGNCALSLMRAIAPWSLDLQLEQAKTMALIAQLSPYQPHAHTLFIQAVSLCEEVVAKDGSQSNKNSTIGTLDRAGIWSGEHPNLGVQWSGQTIEIMTAELPLTIANDYIRSRVHLDHRIHLSRLGRLSDAVDAAQLAVSLSRGLDPVKGKEVLACALDTLGNRLRELRKYEASAAAFEETLELSRSFCRNISVRVV